MLVACAPLSKGNAQASAGRDGCGESDRIQIHVLAPTKGAPMSLLWVDVCTIKIGTKGNGTKNRYGDVACYAELDLSEEPLLKLNCLEWQTRCMQFRVSGCSV